MQMSIQIVFDKTNVKENTTKIICDSMHWLCNTISTATTCFYLQQM